MPTDFSAKLEIIERLLRISGIVAFAYIILIGLIYRAGSKYGTRLAQRQRVREGKPIIKELLRSESPGAFWKDESLLRHGGKVAAIISSYFAGSVAMQVLKPSFKRLPDSIELMMLMATTTFAMMVVGTIWGHLRQRRSFDQLLLGIAAGSAICLVLTTSTFQMFTSQESKVDDAQLLKKLSVIFVIQSLLFACQSGVMDSFKEAADIERQLPIVEVDTVGGKTFSGLRMKSVSQAEYHFIREDGAECVIPSSQVCMIRVVRQAESIESGDTN